MYSDTKHPNLGKLASLKPFLITKGEINYFLGRIVLHLRTKRPFLPLEDMVLYPSNINTVCFREYNVDR